jgi:hypothetical protein
MVKGMQGTRLNMLISKQVHHCTAAGSSTCVYNTQQLATLGSSLRLGVWCGCRVAVIHVPTCLLISAACNDSDGVAMGEVPCSFRPPRMLSHVWVVLAWISCKALFTRFLCCRQAR